MNNLNTRLCDWEGLFESKEFEEEFCYDGNDLGCTYTKDSTSFRVWAPTASAIKLQLFDEGQGDNLLEKHDMVRDIKGTWVITLDGDYKNKYYTYIITFNNAKYTACEDDEFQVNITYVDEESSVTTEAIDIYAKAVGVNGKRGMIVDLESTNPQGWDSDKKPAMKNYTDAVIYELHVRDLSMSEESGIKEKGKFLGIAQTGTKSAEGLSTGLDHIKELGITHIHLLPTQDYGSIDETGKGERVFNWGYDPVNYNVPEGSYSTNPYDGNVRINEFKQMVKGLHDNGIRVVMDVVYNHTFDTVNSNFDKCVPNYYHRTHGKRFTNGSGCGNETASDRQMFRKFMVDSLIYWATEYHVDGFRFDLMGVHDFETMNQIKAAMMKIDPTILLYGEGWIGGPTAFDSYNACFKVQTARLDDIAVFNDDLRDAVKGSITDSLVVGFANGAMYKNSVMFGSREEIINKIRFGLAGAIEHPQVEGKLCSRRPEEYDYTETVFWANNPTQTINYVSAHDNWTLWDKVLMTNTEENIDVKKKMNKLCAAIVFLSQGIPFIHAGEEILRSKKHAGHPSGYEDNSFCMGDDINMLKWNKKAKYIDVFNYYKGLISFRRNFSAFRLVSASEVKKLVKFVEGLREGIIAYTLKNNEKESDIEEFFVAFNGYNEDVAIDIPEGNWNVYIMDDKAGIDIISSVEGKVNISALSTVVLAKAR